jgi:3-oxoacid CoA-transferase subunit A
VDKTRQTAEEALLGRLSDGMTIAVGGFGLCGVPYDLIDVVHRSGVSGLTLISNNLGVDGRGLGLLLENDQVSRVLASYVGENKLFAERYLSGDLDVEFVPQGTLAERLRAGGAGIPAFYTATGYGTQVAEGKPTAVFDGRHFVQERGLVADLGLVHAHTADACGNLRYRATARNFNPLVAAASRWAVAEAEVLLQDSVLAPDDVVTPGIYVDAVVATDRRSVFERRTTRERPAAEPSQGAAAASLPGGDR